MAELLLVTAVSAGALGIIIAVMEEGDFPGWGRMFLCVLVTSAASLLTGILISSGGVWIGPVVGALAGGFMISATCGMALRRACVAAGIYLLLQLSLGYGVSVMMQ